MRRNRIFVLIISVIIIGLMVGVMIRGQERFSIIENKELTQFPSFSLTKFVDTSYQKNLETALSDQLIFNQVLKSSYNKMKSTNMNWVVGSIKELQRDREMVEVAQIENSNDQNEAITDTQGNDSITNERPEETTAEVAEEELIVNPAPVLNLNEKVSFNIDLTPCVNSLIEINDSDHLIYANRTISDAEALFQSKADNYNELANNYPDIEFYSYYIESDVDVNFIEGEINHDLARTYSDMLEDSIQFGGLILHSPEEYQQSFYKTDHHWNAKGQYEGYRTIIQLLKGSSESLVPVETILIPDLKYNGYKSRKLDNYEIYDDFEVLVGDVPEHEEYVNDVLQNYNHKQEYLNGEYITDLGTNHYGECFGMDYGLVEYRFNQPEKENILIFVESFSNPINELIASHYNNTYIVDLRHYEKDFGVPFDFGDFIKSHDVDQVLFTGYYFFYANDTFIIED